MVISLDLEWHCIALVGRKYKPIFSGFAVATDFKTIQDVKILFNPILSYFLAKSYFVLFFWEMSYFILFFGHFAFNFGIL